MPQRSASITGSSIKLLALLAVALALWDEIDGQVVWRVSVLRVESITE